MPDRDIVNRLPAGIQTAWVAPVFVFIWSTGFIGARYGMPYAEPATFLTLRFAGVLVLMVPFVRLLSVPLPPRNQVLHIAVAGLLLQGGYLLGVFEAIRHGMGAGLAALIVGLQPLLTALLGALVQERVTRRQWLGLALGLGGVTLVVWERLSLSGLSLTSVLMSVAALISITLGTLYQKRFTPVFDIRMGSVIQFAAALMLVVPVALLTESREIEWTRPLVGALLWSVLALSLGATSLLFLLIRRGAATKVASLMYLTPGVTAVMAWILFDESFTLLMILGIVLTAAGVLTMIKRPKRDAQPRRFGGGL
jgi:drug/metabolite transporter (DMT)-like permease